MRLVSKAQVKKASLIPQKTGFLEDWPVKSKKTEGGRKKGERNRKTEDTSTDWIKCLWIQRTVIVGRRESVSQKGRSSWLERTLDLVIFEERPIAFCVTALSLMFYVSSSSLSFVSLKLEKCTCLTSLFLGGANVMSDVPLFASIPLCKVGVDTCQFIGSRLLSSGD